MAKAMQERAPLLRLISAEHLRSMAGPLFAAGFSGGDVLHCLDYETAGRQHGYTHGVRHLPGWFRSRMSLWLAPDGTPVPSPSQRRAAVAARTRAEQATWRDARQKAAREAAEVDVREQAARARAMLARRPTPGMAEPGTADRVVTLGYDGGAGLLQPGRAATSRYHASSPPPLGSVPIGSCTNPR